MKNAVRRIANIVLTGVLIVLAAVFLLGLLVDTRLSDMIKALVDGIVKRIPLVGSMHDMISKFVELVSQRSAPTPTVTRGTMRTEHTSSTVDSHFQPCSSSGAKA